MRELFFKKDWKYFCPGANPTTMIFLTAYVPHCKTVQRIQ
jgi:hypothetical protein